MAAVEVICRRRNRWGIRASAVAWAGRGQSEVAVDWTLAPNCASVIIEHDSTDIVKLVAQLSESVRMLQSLNRYLIMPQIKQKPCEDMILIPWLKCFFVETILVASEFVPNLMASRNECIRNQSWYRSCKGAHVMEPLWCALITISSFPHSRWNKAAS